MAVLASEAAASSSWSTAPNPIRKVVKLLQQMEEEITAEGEKEEEMHKKMACYCKKNTANMSKAAEEAAALIERLRAQVAEEKAQKAGTEQELKEAKSDREEARQTLKTATSLREKEKAEYENASAEHKDDLKALDDAIAALKRGMGANAFIQAPFIGKLKQVVSSIQSDAVDSSDRESVMSFIEQSGEYAPQSGQVVGILVNMVDEMDKDLGGIVSAEKAAQVSFGELKAAKEREIAALSEQVESKTAAVGQLAVAIVTHTNQEDDAVESLDEAEKLMAQLKVMCNEKDGEWAERMKIRHEELAAITETIEFLNNDDALDSFKASSLGAKDKKSFLQRSVRKNSALQKAREIFSRVSSRHPPSALVVLAQVAAKRVGLIEKNGQMKGFEKVLAMCDKMVKILKEEQAADDDARDSCNVHIKAFESEEKDQSHLLQQLESSVASMDSEIGEYKTELENSAKENKDLDTSVAEASAARKEEHAEFQEKIKLNTAAKDLVHKAKNRLQKFYSPGLYDAPKEEKATSFVQIKVHKGDEDNSVDKPTVGDAPESWKGDYKNKGQKGNSIMAMMDMLTKDLDADIQESQHAEKTAQKEYEDLMADVSGQKAANKKEITEKEGAKAEVEEARTEAKTNVVITKDQLQTTQKALHDENTKCHFLLTSYDEREALRTREIESIQNAKSVLSGADYS